MTEARKDTFFMIDLHTWPTPNGHKVHILLEELGLPYTIFPVDIGAGGQFDPEFLKISPNNKMPAIVDRDGPDGEPYAVFESGAILLYLADKTGRFIAAGGKQRFDAIQWLMFQMGSVGPMFGQANHFRSYAPDKIPYAIDRYTNEAGRLYGVMNKRLEGREWFCDDYSIADMALYPWTHAFDRRGQDPAEFPNVKRWCDAMKARPAVQRGMAVLAESARVGAHTKEQWEIMFGAKQYARR